ncbi:phosphatase 2C-like domain-containing protein [Chiua virens]|nr:phosphatase 2C-like domain-containing protein [Chiua virens]
MGRIPLHSPKIIGVATSRGDRGHQEDYHAIAALSLDPDGLRLSIKKAFGIDWEPENAADPIARQVVFVGLYDGHGGSTVSQYLRQELHGLFESVDKSHIPELFLWIKDLGGYFKRFRGGALAPWIHNIQHTPPLDLEARATQAFFEVDRLLSIESEAKMCGATASVAILHSLDDPARPFFSSEKLALTVAHCGDARVLLCSRKGDLVYPMTENHHPDSRVEATRLRRMMGSALITDSFGESRSVPALSTLGDLKFKPFGVTPEPEVRAKLLEGRDWASMVVVSDGISSSLSDDEIVDLTRDAPTPKAAADRILSFAQELGAWDNATAIVVPLAGWGQIEGPDKSFELREFRRQQAGWDMTLAHLILGNERRQRML